MSRRPPLLTIGHGGSDGEELGRRLRAAGVRTLVDVRRYPGSRRNPTVGRDALSESLPRSGIDYRWEERLGGRRRVPPGESEQDPWWRVASFRAYSAHTRTPEFAEAMTQLIEIAADQLTAIMCSESVWWRCHRRIIADVAVLVHGVTVEHLMPDGRLSVHEPSDGARVHDGTLVWDRAPTP